MLLAHAGRPDASPWSWHPHPDVLLVVGALVLGYYAAFTRLGPGLVGADEPVVTRRQMWVLGTAIGGFWLMSDWPVHDLSEGYSYSVHMVQHLVYTLVLPPLFLWGTPTWLWRWLVRPVLPVFRLLVRPFVALVVFNTVVAATHWDVLVTAAVRSGAAHLAQHVVLVGAACLMWWPVLSPLRELPRIAPPLQMVYLFLQSLVPTVPASFLALADRPVYRVYEEFPRVLGLSVAEDQQLAGAVMKVGGGLILWAGIVVVFFRWFAAEDRASAAYRRRHVVAASTPAVQEPRSAVVAAEPDASERAASPASSTNGRAASSEVATST